MSEKAMVLCSGGVDSTTCLALAIEKHGKENVCALSIYYGQLGTKWEQVAWNRLANHDLYPEKVDNR